MNANPIPTVKFSLADILKRRHMTKRAAAELTGLTENTIGSLTRDGLQQIRIDTITALCNGLDILPEDLFTITEGGE